MKKLLLMIMLSIPATSFAGWAAGYTVLDLDMGDGDSLSLGAINASYKWDLDDFSTEAGVLIGVQDDKLYGVTAELDPSIYLKGMYNINENVFLAATWTKFEATASYSGYSDSGGDSEAGIGIGFNAGQMTYSFDVVDDTNMFSLQYNF